MNLNFQFNIIHEKPIIAKSLCWLFLVFILFKILKCVYDVKLIYSEPKVNFSSPNLIDGTSNRESIKKSLNFEIFGKYIPKQLGDANIRPSILDLKVIGVMFSENEKKSQVLIRFANGFERIFNIGDVIPGGGKIVHIYTDGIIVNRDGDLERLNLPKDELVFDKLSETLNKNDVN